MKLDVARDFLIAKCNEHLKQKPIIYISTDLERGMGLTEILDYHYSLSAKKSIYDHVCKNNLRTDSTSSYESTFDLIKSHDFNKICQTFKNNFYLRFFQISKEEEDFLKKNDIKYLNNNFSLCMIFEDKVNFSKLLKQNSKIKHPDNIVVDLSEGIELCEQLIVEKFGLNKLLSFQKNSSYSGKGTLFGFASDFLKITQSLGSQFVKVSEYINGITFTINGCIYKSKTFVGAPQVQITGIPKISPSESACIGNDFSAAKEILSSNYHLSKKLFKTVLDVGSLMKKMNFRGLFGVDLILFDDEFYVIEVNARQTANITFESQLEISQGVIPLELISICEWLEIDVGIVQDELYFLDGSQLLIKANEDDTIVKSKIKPGKYKMRGDRIAYEYSLKKLDYQDSIDVIYIDEDRDVIFKWESECMNISALNGLGVLITSSDKNTRVNGFEEMAKIQVKNNLVDICGQKIRLKDWVFKLAKSITEILT
ncbi:ATP-grasp domain-containing protein [Candidatus Dojkabacteria bacterium]|uniref:ATP-grasp domain-containing protein n=1 Tax=Candidatus Dojkabacteria bacterium TaxID=2099670 RepID=A0A3M0Z3S0_9BACT|nr:MAG: ATP-grasp domain-containing protein [Candidatus Dojkabacteria bacterium]